MIDYPFVALCLVAFSILMYVVLDGFGLGVGILFPFMTEKEHEVALKTIAPIWDGNETWLVLGGALLYAAFPKACSIFLPAIYLPLMLMLCALVGRGVALEFRSKAERTKSRWARCFFFSSLLATFCQGCLLGTLVQVGHDAIGLSHHKNLLLFSPFIFLCGVGLCFGYSLLGSGWLMIKTDGAFQEKIRGLAVHLHLSVMIVIFGVLIITPVMIPAISDLWFESGRVFKTMFASVYTFGALYAFWKTLRGSEYSPFLGGIWMFLGGYLVFGYSLYPNLLPGRDFRELAAHPSALHVVVWASFIMLPILLTYLSYSYWVFWGKVDNETSFYK